LAQHDAVDVECGRWTGGCASGLPTRRRRPLQDVVEVNGVRCSRGGRKAETRHGRSWWPLAGPRTVTRRTRWTTPRSRSSPPAAGAPGGGASKEHPGSNDRPVSSRRQPRRHTACLTLAVQECPQLAPCVHGARPGLCPRPPRSAPEVPEAEHPVVTARRHWPVRQAQEGFLDVVIQAGPPLFDCDRHVPHATPRNVVIATRRRALVRPGRHGGSRLFGWMASPVVGSAGRRAVGCLIVSGQRDHGWIMLRRGC